MKTGEGEEREYRNKEADSANCGCPFVSLPVSLPERFLVAPPPPPPKPDKRAILEALKRGEDVPGARIAQGVRVEIR